MCKRLNYYTIMKNFFNFFLFYLLFVLLVLVIPFRVFSQTADSLHSRKLDIGFNYSADYSYRNVTAAESNKNIVAMYDSIEHGRYGSTFGLNGIYSFSDKISLSVGVLFSDKGEKTKVALVDRKLSYLNHYYYLDIPLKGNYFVFKKQIYLTGGISSNLFLKSTIRDVDQDKAENSNLTINKINMSYLGGIGFNQQLSDSWYFKSEVLYRHSINPIMKAPINRYLYSVGISAGFFYQIR